MTSKRRNDGGAPRNPDGPGASRHVPVMLTEVVTALALRDGETYIDATFGAGGYSRAILDAAPCNVLALDRDPSAVRDAVAVCQDFPNRLTVVQSRFATLDDVALVYLSTTLTPETPSIFTPPDGVVFDIGVSSMQLDDAERGFSFQSDGPLDMRMGHAGGALSEGAGPSAAEVVNEEPEERLADIFYQLGEERRSRAVAAAIVRRRVNKPFERTADLAALVSSVPGTHRPDGRHPATRTFQALRIWVNDELGELARGLAAAEAVLKPGGRLVVVTFHSLEDRIVKRFLAQRSGKTAGVSRYQPTGVTKSEPSFRLVNSKSLSPSEQETVGNPRARSARLRQAERTTAAAWGSEGIADDLPEVLRDR